MQELENQLEAVACAPVLLVASDYDGTLAPIVPDPADATPKRESLVALRELAALPHTHVAVISGRSLSELARLLGSPDGVHLVGSHGSEFDLDFAHSLPPNAAELRNRLRHELSSIAADNSGFLIEEKPASVAFHYRNAPEHLAKRALHAVTSGPALMEGVYTRHGKKVVELAVVPTNKGVALETLRQRVGASTVVFLGDDTTDEDAFITLQGPDIGIKVGAGDSQARFRLNETDDVARVLASLYEKRAAWLAGAKAVPIERHAILSDQRTIALVTPEAKIVWLCLPRLDSPALFGELLGGPAAGYFSIAAANRSRPLRQRYASGSMALQTQWRDFNVTDFLDCSSGKHAQRAGRTDLIRLIEGSGRIVIEFAPRLDYGRAETHLVQRDGGLLIPETHDPIVLRSPGVTWQIHEVGQHHVARADVELDPHRPMAISLCYGTGSLRESTTPATDRLTLTNRFWSSWASRLELPRVQPKLIRRSALALKSLCYGPSGAIAAAATTSLPEHLGGVRNWDYRFCWLRDAAMSASALVKLGSQSEGMAFLDWMLNLLRERSPERLQPLYALTGEALGPEAEIAELHGYAGSRPVRVGNAAARQVQLDVFGPIVELISLLIERDAPLSSEHWRLVDAMVQAVERRWHEPDHGIWEIRRPGRHHVHSKLMCWVTVDRAVRIAERYYDRQQTQWMQLRDRIAADLLEHGYKKEVNAFTAAYDGVDHDASALCVGLTGFLSASDPRFRSTVEAIENHLKDGPTVYRYRYDDGLPGAEGGFHLCASWLVSAYLMIGRKDEAWQLFEELVELVGPTGLLSEQYDPQIRRALGNHPQAYSHIGLIENAIALSKTA
jgi:trehalose 6-phosphate phosphatase